MRHISLMISSILTGLLAAALSGALAADPLSLPVWADLFNPSGTLKNADGNNVPDYVDLYGAIDAVFVGDNLSDGVAVDMSAWPGGEPTSEKLVYNGTVSRPHDVGNGYVLATTDTVGNLILYGGIERLGPVAENSFVEFQFTQGVSQVYGVNLPITGAPTAGDLLVRLNLTQGTLSSAEFKQWMEPGGYQTVATVTAVGGVACSGDGLVQLVCDPSLASGGFTHVTSFDPWTEPWDMSGTPVAVPAPNGLLEFGVNVGQLLGSSPDYSSIVVRTPEDIILSGFRNLGYWAQAAQSAD